MKLSVNTRPLRLIVNLLAAFYIIVFLAKTYTIVKSVLAFTFTQAGQDLSYIVSAIGFFLVYMFGVYLAWKLVHMFLDMYDVMAQSQSKMTNTELPKVERENS